jgi:hypothetical protein
MERRRGETPLPERPHTPPPRPHRPPRAR